MLFPTKSTKSSTPSKTNPKNEKKCIYVPKYFVEHSGDEKISKKKEGDTVIYNIRHSSIVSLKRKGPGTKNCS